jgi:hypothetical protein
VPWFVPVVLDNHLQLLHVHDVRGERHGWAPWRRRMMPVVIRPRVMMVWPPRRALVTIGMMLGPPRVLVGAIRAMRGAMRTGTRAPGAALRWRWRRARRRRAPRMTVLTASIPAARRTRRRASSIWETPRIGLRGRWGPVTRRRRPAATAARRKARTHAPIAFERRRRRRRVSSIRPSPSPRGEAVPHVSRPWTPVMTAG